MKLDSKDVQLLMLLQKNGRESLTALAKALNLSIDSTHKRLKRLLTEDVMMIKTYVNPKAIGYEFVVNVQIKLQNISEEDLTKFMAFLKNHPNVVDLIQLLGDYDFTCVLIAKDTAEIEILSREIRHKFRNVIADWHSVINLKVHKFEEYAVDRLLKQK
jgi:Lrp/AsnC family leucine-responsive transcriptional regulator